MPRDISLQAPINWRRRKGGYVCVWGSVGGGKRNSITAYGHSFI